MPVGWTSSGSGSVAPAPNFSSLFLKEKCCVAGAVLGWVSWGIIWCRGAGLAPLGFSCGDTRGLVPVSFRAAVPSSAILGASAASTDGEALDDSGYGERLAMAAQIWWVEG